MSNIDVAVGIGEFARVGRRLHASSQGHSPCQLATVALCSRASKASTDRCPLCLDGEQLWTHHQRASRSRRSCAAIRTSGCWSLTGSFGEILGGKLTWGCSCPKRVSVTNTPNELMRRCLLRWQTETSGDTFSH